MYKDKSKILITSFIVIGLLFSACENDGQSNHSKVEEYEVEVLINSPNQDLYMIEQEVVVNGENPIK